MANTWSQAQTWSVSSTFKNNLNVEKVLTVNGNFNGKQFAGTAIELTNVTPYIDFHHDNSTTDYTHRIITEDGALAIYPGLRVRGSTRTFGQSNVEGNLWWGFIATTETDPGAPSNGTVLNSPNSCWRFKTRGADGKGAPAGMATAWFEEQVGTNHRFAISVQGFNANQQWWQFLSDGRIYSSQNGNVQFQGTSDARLKHDIEPTDGQLSVDRIRALKLVTFIKLPQTCIIDDKSNDSKYSALVTVAIVIVSRYLFPSPCLKIFQIRSRHHPVSLYLKLTVDRANE